MKTEGTKIEGLKRNRAQLTEPETTISSLLLAYSSFGPWKLLEHLLWMILSFLAFREFVSVHWIQTLN